MDRQKGIGWNVRCAAGAFFGRLFWSFSIKKKTNSWDQNFSVKSRSVCLVVCLSSGLSVVRSVCRPVSLSVSLCVCQSVCRPVSPSVCLSVCPSVSLSSGQSVCQSVCLSVCVSSSVISLSVCRPVCLSSGQSVCRRQRHSSVLSSSSVFIRRSFGRSVGRRQNRHPPTRTLPQPPQDAPHPRPRRRQTPSAGSRVLGPRVWLPAAWMLACVRRDGGAASILQ